MELYTLYQQTARKCQQPQRCFWAHHHHRRPRPSHPKEQDEETAGKRRAGRGAARSDAFPPVPSPSRHVAPRQHLPGARRRFGRICQMKSNARGWKPSGLVANRAGRQGAITAMQTRLLLMAQGVQVTPGRSCT